MLLAYLPTPGLPDRKSPSKPTPTHTQLSWATILLFRKLSDAFALARLGETIAGWISPPPGGSGPSCRRSSPR